MYLFEICEFGDLLEIYFVTFCTVLKSLDDVVCNSAGYWYYLQHRKEINSLNPGRKIKNVFKYIFMIESKETIKMHWGGLLRIVLIVNIESNKSNNGLVPYYKPLPNPHTPTPTHPPTPYGINKLQWVNSLRPSDSIWRYRSESTLVKVMACYLTAPSHYLNQYWLIISKVWWHSSESNFIRDTSATIH